MRAPNQQGRYQMATTVIGTIETPKPHRRWSTSSSGRPQEAGRRGARGPEKQIVAQIVEHGFDEDDARGYAQGGPRRQDPGRRAGARPEDRRGGGDHRAPRGRGRRGVQEQGETVQEVEEELSVGKRRRDRRRAGDHQRSERPVEQTVTLREEKVGPSASRDRELSPKEAEAAFQGKTVEVSATSEEAEVSKRPAWSARSLAASQVGRARGDGEEDGAAHRGRGREDRRQAVQAANGTLPAKLSAKPGTSAGLFSAEARTRARVSNDGPAGACPKG